MSKSLAEDLSGTDMGTDPRMYQLTFRILESEDEHFYGHEYGIGLDQGILKKIYRSNALNITTQQ